MFTFLRSSLFYWLPPVKSNPYGLRSRDYNFQLLACNIFSRESFIIFIIIVFFNLNRFFIVFVCFPDCQFLIYFYACSSVYFTFSTIAMPLLLSHDLHVRLFYTCCSINTQKYSLKVNGLFFLTLCARRLNQWAHWARAQGPRIFFFLRGPQLAVVK